MEHLLDNPIWNALNTGNARLAQGNDHARFFPEDFAGFAGLKNNSERDFEALWQLLPPKRTVVLFLPEVVRIPAGWTVTTVKDLLQLVFEQEELIESGEPQIQPLTARHVPQMLKLVEATNPGPFFQRTIEFGNYQGIFDGDTLVAMAGQRLQPRPYVEISAVCTAPDYLKRGYAAALLRQQIRAIKRASAIPFLHVLPENTAALHLYEKLGFRTRKLMQVYVLEKQ
ncbi:GNAT family N-acetyltransferase [Pedobacter sp. SYSU D00535]|uniref:GNAT family N-acetyltransferase n=1 Tax=Pedobacter sp. SYSU D00535 TaxID=2810308 RepID=UPI001A9702A7|nr:GNAT family N-acetyltransferase [Pedobacter sp. SYSU D00535]